MQSLGFSAAAEVEAGMGAARADWGQLVKRCWKIGKRSGRVGGLRVPWGLWVSARSRAAMGCTW